MREFIKPTIEFEEVEECDIITLSNPGTNPTGGNEGQVSSGTGGSGNYGPDDDWGL